MFHGLVYPQIWEDPDIDMETLAIIEMFSNNVYRYGLLGRFIGIGHAYARLYGVNPRDFLRARSRAGPC